MWLCSLYFDRSLTGNFNYLYSEIINYVSKSQLYDNKI